ncbi:hypothetical protein VTJ83DRAFT_5782 [Remersonia thermophila]|uniref:Uncharacterized protein n=1 Tax=Remersonia thermophila TaxID=72144 RepID=A0ABR4D8L0_9PEZI
MTSEPVPRLGFGATSTTTRARCHKRPFAPFLSQTTASCIDDPRHTLPTTTTRHDETSPRRRLAASISYTIAGPPAVRGWAGGMARQNTPTPTPAHTHTHIQRERERERERERQKREKEREREREMRKREQAWQNTVGGLAILLFLHP